MPRTAFRTIAHPAPPLAPRALAAVGALAQAACSESADTLQQPVVTDTTIGPRCAPTRRRAHRLRRFGDACREERARRAEARGSARTFRCAGRVLLVLMHGWYQGRERPPAPPAATTHAPSSFDTNVSNGPFGKTRVLHLSFHWVPLRGTETRDGGGPGGRAARARARKPASRGPSLAIPAYRSG